MRMDAHHRDGTAKPFLRHVQQEQPARDDDAAGGCRLLTIIAVVVLVGEEDDEVEADAEADAERFPGADLAAAGARPAVCAGEVVQ